MNLELALILGFIFHFVGDYLFQNDWMAQNKTKNFLPCLIHATIYSFPFLFLVPSKFWLILYFTHFFIDRYRLAIYWIQIINVKYQEISILGAGDWIFNDKSNFGYDKDKPHFMSIWLMIIIDNTFHVLFNSLSIFLHYYNR